MSNLTPTQPVFRFNDVSARKPQRFDLTPDAHLRTRIADELGISDIRKLTFQGRLTADGKSDWLMEAELGATVVQPCVVTLEPVVTRIDKPVVRRFVAGFAAPVEGEETEMPEDETIEPLPDEINMIEILTEALTLALPDYPRSENATLETESFAAPGVTPMTDDDVKPFSGLAALRDKLEK